MAPQLSKFTGAQRVTRSLHRRCLFRDQASAVSQVEGLVEVVHAADFCITVVPRATRLLSSTCCHRPLAQITQQAMSDEDDDPVALVLDNGSGMMKAALARSPMLGRPLVHFTFSPIAFKRIIFRNIFQRVLRAILECDTIAKTTACIYCLLGQVGTQRRFSP